MNVEYKHFQSTWVHCNKEYALECMDFHIKDTKDALIQLRLMRDAIEQRGMAPFGDLEFNGMPMGTSVTLWDNRHHTRISAMLAHETPYNITDKDGKVLFRLLDKSRGGD